MMWVFGFLGRRVKDSGGGSRGRHARNRENLSCDDQQTESRKHTRKQAHRTGAKAPAQKIPQHKKPGKNNVQMATPASKHPSAHNKINTNHKFFHDTELHQTTSDMTDSCPL